MTLLYQNPLPIKNIGDPFVLRTSDGNYYCYATSASDGFKAWTSTDLVHWTDIGYAYKRNHDSWGKSDFWAPEVVFHNNKYFMHYSARWGTNKSLLELPFPRPRFTRQHCRRRCDRLSVL